MCAIRNEWYSESVLSKFQRYSAQPFKLLVMIEKIRIKYNKGVFASVLTDLWKGFDCIPHILLKQN